MDSAPGKNLAGNRLLQTLEPLVATRFADQFQAVDLARGQEVQRPGEIVDWVYFPVTGVIALLAEALDGESVESGLVGCDGVAGAFEACGSHKSFARAVVQIAGAGFRIRASAYRKLYDCSRNIRTAVHKYIELLAAESRQFVACNALHSVESRLSRSILEASERSGAAGVLPLTQESLAQMIGAQRTTVAVSISKLQRRGILRSGRAALEILDAAALEEAACSCRAILKTARQEIYSSDTVSCEAAVG